MSSSLCLMDFSTSVTATTARAENICENEIVEFIQLV